MGYGSYKSTDWDALRGSRNINDSSKLEDLYTAKQMKQAFSPYQIKYRESLDSPDNPNSTAIIFGLDVTGSMGYLSEEIAKGALNTTMVEIYDKQPVSNPHIMFQAIGDSKSDISPLQVTQFEADIRIVEQLLDIWFEGHGGGNGGESYLQTWYFAAKHTKIDCFDKRKKKGFIFTIGDERTHKDLTREEIRRVFGEESYKDYSAEELYQLASERYEVFHIVMKAGSYHYQNSGADWKQLIGNHAIELDPEHLTYLPEIFVSVMQATKGMEKEVILQQWTEAKRQVIGDILDTLIMEEGQGETIVFR